MKTKLFSFKFQKKSSDSQQKTCKFQKKYENIFNDILNREKKGIISENNNKNEFSENKINSNKKNKIKCIEKVSNKLDNKNNNLSYITCHEIKNRVRTESSFTDANQNNNDQEYENKFKNIMTENNNIILFKQFGADKNSKKGNLISGSNSYNKENKKPKFFPKSKKKGKKNNITELSMEYNINNYSKINVEKKEFILIKNDIIKKKVKEKPIVNIVKGMKEYDLTDSYFNTLNSNDSITKCKNIENKKSKKYVYEKDNPRKISFYKIKNLLHKNNIKTNNYHKHFHHRNYANKITITNDNFEDSSKLSSNLKSINSHFNNKRKNLILNNTNNNINININITNINEKNSDKKNSDFSCKKKPELISENNNFSNNITTVNIINNNNCNVFNKKKIFFNRQNKKLSNLNRIKQGIKIQSININLGEESNNRNRSFNNKNKNLRYKDNINYNFFSDKSLKFKDLDSEKKETQSEYEYFRDYEDFWSSSNRSLSNFSWKSGFTASRRLRNLNQERDKIKIINMEKKNENDMDKIGNKLLNIVNNFHKNSPLNSSRLKRKNFKGKRKDTIKGKDFHTINAYNRKRRLKK